ncbi:hypothetical protein SAMN05661008_00519 [Alkalithermobacter thermoalcaliphilus JW-YL-7 = DSM 7308]|uniref:PASTA domain-containing protein n=1 Tax=Alkalithermobacter thermoalcaliphilus JW-YL-7 = DSM 7308 TaxID=1121328 RepID=A0A150FQB3_CLOPD|nr:hypothetical protein JWYL7_0878 [[Clostridium] paradoxum JW-YL-7 = DSM 7308]SHK59915.1 hypothetical protein SAMN05661008_00519 [[Clostridium] paradoxum JW-YL-7 = DSM 7308]
MDLEKILGTELSQAKKILKDNNIEFEIIETVGYKDTDILKVPRVVNIEINNNKAYLTVTYFSIPLS